MLLHACPVPDLCSLLCLVIKLHLQQFSEKGVFILCACVYVGVHGVSDWSECGCANDRVINSKHHGTSWWVDEVPWELGQEWAFKSQLCLWGCLCVDKDESTGRDQGSPGQLCVVGLHWEVEWALGTHMSRGQQWGKLGSRVSDWAEQVSEPSCWMDLWCTYFWQPFYFKIFAWVVFKPLCHVILLK